ncbi:MAG: exo-alpha-sialidase [Planctomycetaceae bacterium]|nr:exo-alpha-sialidase [Planctomycetaceae bacterium]
MRHRIWWIGALFVGLAPAMVAAQERPAAAAAPFSIPQFDLAARKELQVTVDREAGQYLGHPTTVLLEDGRTMIIVYPKGHGRGGIVMKRSTDGGLTWSERLPVPASWATSQEVPTLYRTIDKAGKKRLIMFSGLYPIRQAVSEDDGATWSELAPIGDYGGIVACASCTRLANGDYMALFHDDGRYLTATKPPKGTKPKFVVFKIISSDGGLTWSKPTPIATHDVAHLCEPGMVRSPDGKQLAVLLRENARKLRSFIIFSNDEGVTWSEPREVPAALTGDRHTCAYLKDGKLFITFRDQLKGSPTPGDWVAWVGTYDDLFNGGEGLYRLRLMDNTKGADCAYPPVEVLPDGTVVTTTYGHWTAGEEPYIVSVRLTRELQKQLATNTRELKDFETGVSILQDRIRTAKTDSRIETDEQRRFHIEVLERTLNRQFEWREKVLKLESTNVVMCRYGSENRYVEWQRLPDLNDPQGFAGQFVGTINNKLVLYGGTNFPGKKVWEGGTKVWYHDAFVLDDPQSEWRKIGKLPDSRAVGYGVSISTDEGLLCIGGATATEHLTDVFLLGLDGDQLTTRDLPKLPAPNAYMSGAQIGSVIYVAGGLAKPDDVRTMRTFWSLDLKNLDAGWQVLEPWPGNGRMLAVTAAVDGKFYLSGGTDLWIGPEGKSIRAYQNDSFCYTPGEGWKKIASAPTGIVAAPTPAVVDGTKIIVFGGDDGSRLGHKPPQDHPGFPKSVYMYDTAADKWDRIGQAPFVPVATPIVKWHGGYVTASGEIRPAVRSREVWMLRIEEKGD